MCKWLHPKGDPNLTAVLSKFCEGPKTPSSPTLTEITLIFPQSETETSDLSLSTSGWQSWQNITKLKKCLIFPNSLYHNEISLHNFIQYVNGTKFKRKYGIKYNKTCMNPYLHQIIRPRSPCPHAYGPHVKANKFTCSYQMIIAILI